jgi:5-methylcytosine-specific restriction endonuclease McrA
MVTCATCGAEKDRTAFAPSVLRKPSKVCRECKSTYNRQWYEQNRDRQLESSRRRGRRQRQITRDILRRAKDRPCLDCGERFPPEAMDFDHVKGTKVRVVSQLVNFPVVRLLAEIEKCELVCANCHRIRSARRLIALGNKVRGFRESDLVVDPRDST